MDDDIRARLRHNAGHAVKLFKRAMEHFLPITGGRELVLADTEVVNKILLFRFTSI